MYKPHFCAECGEQVVRLKWRPWTSRSFCDNCATRFRRSRLVWPFVAGIAILVGGFAAGRSLQSQPPPLMVLRGNLPPTSPEKPAPKSDPAADQASISPEGTTNEPPTDASEVTYICGARTKKGTPCQRRVRFPGRCYQHKGQPAMLPEDKLIVKG